MAGGDKGGSQKQRARGEELELRLDRVESLIVAGWSRAQIVKACAVEWDLSARQADDYVAKVHARWQKERHRTRPAARERQVRRLMRWLRKADDPKEPNFRALQWIEGLLCQIEGTTYRDSDDLAGAGNVDVVIERVRNPDVPKPEEK